jgi:hypothetical protein
MDPSDADKTLERRSVRARPPRPDATQEIAIDDILEVAELASIDVEVHFEPDTSERRAPHSVAPFEIDVPRARADSTFVIPALEYRGPRRKLGWVVGSVLGTAVVILGAGLLRHASEPDELPVAAAVQVPRAELMPTLPRAPRATARLSTAGEVPVVALDSLPQAPVGTIVGAAHRRLTVDGSLVRGSSAVVGCGKHAVKVGWAKKARWVDVPCGSEVTVR